MSLRGKQEKVSGIYHDGILSGMERTKKLFHVSILRWDNSLALETMKIFLWKLTDKKRWQANQVKATKPLLGQLIWNP